MSGNVFCYNVPLQETDFLCKLNEYFHTHFTSIFIKQSSNKVEILRANIASEHVTMTLVTGTTAATFSSFEKVSQLTVKECILISAPKSCEFDLVPSNLLTEYLDSILSLIYTTFLLHLASSLNTSNQLLSHIFSKRFDFITMI